MSPAPLRSSCRAPNSIDAEHIKRRGYLDQGIAVISVNDPRLGWHERELLKQMAEKVLGVKRPQAVR